MSAQNPQGIRSEFVGLSARVITIEAGKQLLKGAMVKVFNKMMKVQPKMDLLW